MSLFPALPSTVSSNTSYNIDPAFLELCLTFRKDEIPAPIPPTPTLVSENATVPLEKLLLSDKNSDVDCLTDKYPQAWSDFYPSRAPCIYKSGGAWKVRTGPQEQGIVREIRPVVRPDVAPVWVSILEKICEHLDSMGVDFTSINPLGYTNEGELEPFCPFILSVSVTPHSLTYEAAVVTAGGIKDILAKSGLPEVEVAFVESVVKRSVGGLKLLPFNPIIDDVPEYRKHFTSALGLSIAPLKTPYYEGTGGLFFRLGSNDNRVAVLTCAHVARPLSAFPDNKGMTRTNKSQPREKVVALGDRGYTRAVANMIAEIAQLHRAIAVWNMSIDMLSPDSANFAKRRKEFADEIDKATKRIDKLDAFHTEVTKFRGTPGLRVIGWVLHTSPIKVSVQPLGYTDDWGFVELDHGQIDWNTFLGNKVFIGGKLSPGKFIELMYPHPEDEANYRYPLDSLLQACDVVSEAEIRNPKHLDANGQPCLFVTKNGGATDVTVGRANGLESVKRTYPEHGTVKEVSLELAVLPYNEECGAFSDTGDSGSIVLTREGKIFGMITGSAGPTNEADLTFVTPYWWLEKRIKAKFPNAYLYEVVPNWVSAQGALYG